MDNPSTKGHKNLTELGLLVYISVKQRAKYKGGKTVSDKGECWMKSRKLRFGREREREGKTERDVICSPVHESISKFIFVFAPKFRLPLIHRDPFSGVRDRCRNV